MGTNNNTSSSIISWDLDIVNLSNQFLLDQVSFDLVQSIDPPKFHNPPPSFSHSQTRSEENEYETLGTMKETMYMIAAMQPVDIDPSTIKKPKRRNVQISDEPQSIAARHRRERISEKMRILQRLVPGGTKMDTASMLDEAIRYVKFLKKRVQELQSNQLSAELFKVFGGNPADPTSWLVGTQSHGSPPSSNIGAPPDLRFGHGACGM